MPVYQDGPVVTRPRSGFRPALASICPPPSNGGAPPLSWPPLCVREVVAVVPGGQARRQECVGVLAAPSSWACPGDSARWSGHTGETSTASPGPLAGPQAAASREGSGPHVGTSFAGRESRPFSVPGRGSGSAAASALTAAPTRTGWAASGCAGGEARLGPGARATSPDVSPAQAGHLCRAHGHHPAWE